MEGSFLQIRHVILDEVQNFQAEDGDWLEEARKLVRQHIECESTHDDYASDNESVLEFFSESETEQDTLIQTLSRDLIHSAGFTKMMAQAICGVSWTKVNAFISQKQADQNLFPRLLF